MKTKLFALAGTFFLLYITACNNGASTTTTDSTTVTTGSVETGSEDVSASKNINVHLDPSVSYVNLKTGKQVRLRVDTVTKYIVDEVSNEPVMYYINPATNDTFDQSGRLVNNALVRSSDGEYTIDESRLTESPDENNDMESNDTSNNAAEDETTLSGNSRTKLKDDKFKHRTDTSRIKIKENKLKVRTRTND